MKTCPMCASEFLECTECGKVFPHGSASNCDEPSCMTVNAPLDCSDCGYVASNCLGGVLNYDMELIPY